MPMPGRLTPSYQMGVSLSEQMSLSWVLNESTESAKRITGGRLFQHRGLAAEKARSPKCILILRTRRSVPSSDWSHGPDAGLKSEQTVLLTLSPYSANEWTLTHHGLLMATICQQISKY